MATGNVLVVAADAHKARLVEKILTSDGHTVQTVATADEAQTHLLTESYDVVVQFARMINIYTYENKTDDLKFARYGDDDAYSDRPPVIAIST